MARRLLAVGAVVLVVAALGCTPWGRGTYQVEIFSEMHYSQAYKSQEPPRLSPPSGAVPFKSVGEGRLIASDYYITEGYQRGSESAKALYITNCIFCHGSQGKGDGAVKDYLLKWGGYHQRILLEGLPLVAPIKKYWTTLDMAGELDISQHKVALSRPLQCLASINYSP